MTAPFFSIIIATYNRGKHIIPTIESALAQSEQDFEILVVGDGCTDNTEAAVRSIGSPKISWHSLAQNTGNQSGPNNAGIRAARGSWIAYLGHDDIWAPDHLAELRGIIFENPQTDFAVSGCVWWGPPGSVLLHVTGIFETADSERHSYPPSSIAHRREVTSWIGEWKMPETIKVSVDTDFLRRAHGAQLHFESTRKITVHKFNALERYLSYLRVSSDEQRATLEALRAGKMPASDAIIAESQRRGMFMPVWTPIDAEEGAITRSSRRTRGVTLPPLQELRLAVTFEPNAEDQIFDWWPVEHDGRRAWTSAQNPRPYILIPYSGAAATVEIEIEQASSSLQQQGVPILIEREEITARIIDGGNGKKIVFDLSLKPDDYTTLSILLLPSAASPAPSLEQKPFEPIVIGKIHISPRL